MLTEDDSGRREEVKTQCDLKGESCGREPHLCVYRRARAPLWGRLSVLVPGFLRYQTY